MQPINLLPPYIYDKQKKTALVAIWGAIAAVLLIGCVAWGLNLSSKVSQAQSEKDQAQSYADQWSKADSAITQANQAVADERQKLTFITNAKKWNDTWPEIFEMMRDWTSPQILLRAMSLDPAQHRTISLNGFAEDERKIIQWWMLLRNNPKLEAPNFSLPPHDYAPVNAQANAGGFQGGGFGGRPGMMGFPGMPGGPGGRAGMMMGQMGPMGPGGFAGRGGFGGAAGFGGTSGNVGQTEIEGRRGIEFTATAMLREPFAGGIPLPTWPPSGGGAVGAGAAGGYRGMMGGMPGMPGGMPGMGPMMGRGAMGPGGPPPGAAGPSSPLGGGRAMRGED
jgi:Tfp pilus assembly protein PilN